MAKGGSKGYGRDDLCLPIGEKIEELLDIYLGKETSGLKVTAKRKRLADEVSLLIGKGSKQKMAEICQSRNGSRKPTAKHWINAIAKVLKVAPSEISMPLPDVDIDGGLAKLESAVANLLEDSPASLRFILQHNHLKTMSSVELAGRIFAKNGTPPMDYLDNCTGQPVPGDDVAECKRVLTAIAQAIAPACLNVKNYVTLCQYINGTSGTQNGYQEIDAADVVVATGIIARAKGAAMRTDLLPEFGPPDRFNASIARGIAIPVPPELGRSREANRDDVTFLDCVRLSLASMLHTRSEREAHVREALAVVAKRDVLFCLLLPRESQQLAESYDQVRKAFSSLIVLQSTVDEDSTENIRVLYQFQTFLEYIRGLKP